MLKAIATILLVLSNAALAQLQPPKERGAYIGLGFGQAKNNLDYRIGSNISKDDSDAYSKLYAGYQFNRLFGAELFYANLGTSTYKSTLNNAPSQDQFKNSVIGVNGVLFLPIRQPLSFVGKLGLGAATSKYTCVQACNNVANNSTTSTSAQLGLGLQYQLSSGLGLRVEYERYGGINHKINTSEATASFDAVAASIQYKF
ncbi:outer membrane beta-barrel protein [Parvibium lacunae]|uniref:Outer membrane protein OmpA-like transmembrane domain-containing protein n=1 Tax=Parvibium lacunae TaxID=1888893 RepID=A0A368L0M2_9BURK|nr:outer membrane beta-barrel protein [Parvibium lacunae]RCS57099.1 hypothetical protein DU000_09860 [Parvibium lacunae]